MSMFKCVCEWVWERKRKNLSSTSMKGQFITVCCGRQNILPQCFAGPVDCLNEEWERISTRAASAQQRLAPNHHSPQYRPGSEVKSGAATEACGPLYAAHLPLSRIDTLLLVPALPWIATARELSSRNYECFQKGLLTRYKTEIAENIESICLENILPCYNNNGYLNILILGLFHIVHSSESKQVSKRKVEYIRNGDFIVSLK